MASQATDAPKKPTLKQAIAALEAQCRALMNPNPDIEKLNTALKELETNITHTPTSDQASAMKDAAFHLGTCDKMITARVSSPDIPEETEEKLYEVQEKMLKLRVAWKKGTEPGEEGQSEESLESTSEQVAERPKKTEQQMEVHGSTSPTNEED